MEKLPKSNASSSRDPITEEFDSTDDDLRFLRIDNVGRAVYLGFFYRVYGDFGVKNVALAHYSHPKRFAYVEFKSSAAAKKAQAAVSLASRLVKASDVEPIPPAETNPPPPDDDVGRVLVTGYDPSLPKKDIYNALSKYFSSCGEIRKIMIPRDFKNGGHHSIAILSMNGKGSQEKALKLSGRDVGGLNFSVLPELPVPDHGPHFLYPVDDVP